MRKTVLLTLSLSAMMCWAVPARKDARIVRQADGTQITVYAHGDEHFSWQTNEQGQWVEKNEEGNYVVVEERHRPETEAINHYSYQAPEAAQTAFPLNIVPRGLVVLAEFQDVHFSTPKETIDSMLNAENFTREYTYIYPGTQKEITIQGNGSVRKYFESSSMGAYSPKFDVIGPLCMKRTRDYYGKNASATSRDTHISEFVTDLCDMIVASGVDLSLYDSNNDNYIDYLGIIYAGEGEADGGGENTIWPHKYEVTYYKTITSQGKTFKVYNCNPEMNSYTGHYMGIGTFCHEFGHVMGLPDIYSTNGSTTHKTNGEWDIMDYGCYVNEGDAPPAYTGYERFYMGWATPRLLTEAENVTLKPLYDSNEVLMITATGKSNMKGNDPDPNEFYILDNRQQKGFDSHIPGHGMILTKINYLYGIWYGNSVNKVADDLHIDLIEADSWAAEYDGSSRAWFGKPGDAFPTGSKEYLLIKDNPITDIKETNGIITFRFKGGMPTDVEDVEATDNEVRKEMRDGKLVIVKDGITYSPTGIIVK